MEIDSFIKLAQELSNKYAQDAANTPLTTIEQAQLFTLVSYTQKAINSLFRAFGETAPQIGQELLVKLRSEQPGMSSKEAKQIAQLVLNAASAIQAMNKSADDLLKIS